MLIPMLANADGFRERKRMTGAGIFLGRRNDPDIIADRAGYCFQHLKAWRVHPIIIGQQYTHQAAGSNFVMPPI
jgi:hypothetical protein